MTRYPMMTPGRQELVGRLNCDRWANFRRGRNGTTLAHVIADAVAPLPPIECWTLQVEHGDPEAVRPFWFVQQRNKWRKPAAFADIPEGSTVRVRVTIEPYSNGMGGYASRMVVLEVLSRPEPIADAEAPAASRPSIIDLRSAS
jgi:hypothetical protein